MKKNLNSLYKEIIPFHISGMPCLIGVTYYENVVGSYNQNAESDCDYYGYTDRDYDILDRKGYKATWLEKKATKFDINKIEEAIDVYFEQLKEYYETDY